MRGTVLQQYTEDGSGSSWGVERIGNSGRVVVAVTEVCTSSNGWPGSIDSAYLHLNREEALNMAKKLIECAGGDFQ